MNLMNRYSGRMSVYFPCKVKSEGGIERLNKRWKNWHQRKVNFIHHTHAPLTDLMDKEQNRYISENSQRILQRRLKEKIKGDEDVSPYALKCLQQAYRKNREDNLFAKNVQILLSKFSLCYHVKHKQRDIKCNGLLFLNVNPDNSIATSVVVLDFENLLAMDIIYLKHVFYKRLLVSLEEEDIDSLKKVVCDKCKWMDCIVSKKKQTNVLRTRVQDYVNRKFERVYIPHNLEYDVDYRARSSFIELYNDLPKKNPQEHIDELYGLLHADEGYEFVPRECCQEGIGQSYSTRKDYDLYIAGLNAMIVTRDLNGRKLCKTKHREFESGYDESLDNIRTEPIEGMCIPGVLEEFFPSFLKAVEVHYLINKITTNEIALHERSYVYPGIFLKRLVLLWELLYELDTHKYHINQDFHREFGIIAQLEIIRQEYNSILVHAMSYSAGIIAIFTAFLTILTLVM